MNGKYFHQAGDLGGNGKTTGGNTGGGENMKTCPSCGSAIPVNAQFCTQCGLQFQPQGLKPFPGGDKKKPAKLKYMIIAGAVAAVLVVAVVLILFLSTTGTNKLKKSLQHTWYWQDEEYGEEAEMILKFKSGGKGELIIADGSGETQSVDFKWKIDKDKNMSITGIYGGSGAKWDVKAKTENSAYWYLEDNTLYLLGAAFHR